MHVYSERFGLEIAKFTLPYGEVAETAKPPGNGWHYSGMTITVHGRTWHYWRHKR
jgi:hypothetical protein